MSQNLQKPLLVSSDKKLWHHNWSNPNDWSCLSSLFGGVQFSFMSSCFLLLCDRSCVCVSCCLVLRCLVLPLSSYLLSSCVVLCCLVLCCAVLLSCPVLLVLCCLFFLLSLSCLFLPCPGLWLSCIGLYRLVLSCYVLSLTCLGLSLWLPSLGLVCDCFSFLVMVFVLFQFCLLARKTDFHEWSEEEKPKATNLFCLIVCFHFCLGLGRSVVLSFLCPFCPCEIIFFCSFLPP